MTDLDRQIAEIKGWEYDLKEGIVWTTPHVPRNEHGIVDGGREGLDPGYCCWSTSDSKALELVDELVGPKTNMLNAFTFHLWLSPNDWQWHAGFVYMNPGFPDLGFRDSDEKKGVGSTRPEAICRAYIAAKQFLNQKGR